MLAPSKCLFFFFNDTATTEIYTLSLHDALPISQRGQKKALLALVETNAKHSFYQRFRVMKPSSKAIEAALQDALGLPDPPRRIERSEEHTSELQSPCNLVCRLLLETRNTSC